MNGTYSIRREPEALSLPFGAGGVAATLGIALGLVGLLVPTAWLETIAFQLYLDTVTPAAAPPLGTTARIVAALALAAFGALLGYVLAKAFGVVASDTGFADLIARLRGPGADDEADAPPLRAADRHPDAPARRPFSPARDLAGADDADGEGSGYAGGHDELLLDAPFDDVVVDHAPVAANGDTAVDFGRTVDSNTDDLDLIPPSLDDWEREGRLAIAAEGMPVEADDAVVTPGDAYEALAETVAPPTRPARPPLDLSVARLDELIARLENGLSRRAAPEMTYAAPSPSGAPVSAIRSQVESVSAAQSEVAEDPAFPNDPALAAALATLRKMNVQAG